MNVSRGLTRSTARSIDRSVTERSVGGGAPFVLPAPLDDYQSELVASASIARRLTSDYTGNLFKAFKSGGSTYVVGQDADGNADTAGLLAWAGSDSCYLQSVYAQPSGTEVTLDTSAATARRVVNAGVLETDAAGVIKAVVVTADTGRLVFGIGAQYTGDPLSAYMFGGHGLIRPGGDNRYFVLTDGASNSFGIAAFLDGYRSSATSFIAARTVPVSIRVWQHERVATAIRYDGTTARIDGGGQIASASEAQNFQIDKVIFGGFSSGVSYSGVGEYFQEFAVWTSDIGQTALRTICDNARYYYASDTAWRGKKLVWLGTSMPVTVTDASNVNPYPQQVASELGCHIVNEGEGSSRLTYSASYQLTLTATVAEQVANGFSGFSSQSFERKVLGQNGDPDWFVIDHCLNDFDQTQGLIGSTNKAEYFGALNFIRSEILGAYPSAKILTLTPPSAKSTVHNEAQVRTAAANLIAWSTAHGYPCIDLLSALDLPVGSLGDGTHLNAASAALVADEIIAEMQNITP